MIMLICTGFNMAITDIILATNFVITLIGFKNVQFLNKMMLDVKIIHKEKEYWRFITSGFIHANWMHFFFNMFALYSFGAMIEQILRAKIFILIYLISLLGGNVVAFLINRKRENYKALGASGAVSGIVFCSILLHPQGEIMFFFIPYGIKSWIFGVGYMAFSIYAVIRDKSNIGHEAHIGGALAGLFATLYLASKYVLLSSIWIMVLIVPTMFFIGYFIQNSKE